MKQRGLSIQKFILTQLRAAGRATDKREQDFSSRIVAVVNKDLDPWQVVNAVAHMEAVIGNELPKQKLVSGEHFIGSDEIAIPRNSQYPIIIMRSDEKNLHKLHQKVVASGLKNHVFIKDMQDTNSDAEIVQILSDRPIAETVFYGVSFFAPNDLADELTKGLQLWEVGFFVTAGAVACIQMRASGWMLYLYTSLVVNYVVCAESHAQYVCYVTGYSDAAKK